MKLNSQFRCGIGLFLLSLLFLLPATLFAQEQSDVNDSLTAQRFAANHKIELDYLIALPDQYATKEKWPLVLFLHGAGERGANLELVKKHGPPKLIEGGKSFPFITVAPQCPRDRWWEPVSLAALLDEIETKYKVDSRRIYVTGLSMGGFGTWSLAAHSPERFAAIIPICGGGDRFSVPYQIQNRIPIWAFHGAKDTVVPLDRSEELVEAFKKYNAEFKMTVYPDAGHDSWTETYENDELYQWMLSQQLAEPAEGADDVK